MKKKRLEILMAVVLLLGAFFVSRQGAAVVETAKELEAGGVHTIVVDAGHGGRDPGKVGVNDVLEKDLNLSIAKKLKVLLEAEGIQVVMTREEDIGLYDEDTSNKKIQDMQRRCALINETDPAFTVSIHQNSYNDSSVSGAQVFYYSHSTEGKKIATVIQDSIETELSGGEGRGIKANNNYYLLKNSSGPIVIIECGFLSNYEDAQNMVDEKYQERLAEAIKNASLEYLDSIK